LVLRHSVILESATSAAGEPAVAIEAALEALPVPRCHANDVPTQTYWEHATRRTNINWQPNLSRLCRYIPFRSGAPNKKDGFRASRVQMIKTEDGTHVWAETTIRAVTDDLRPAGRHRAHRCLRSRQSTARLLRQRIGQRCSL